MSVLGKSDSANFIFFYISHGQALPSKDEFSKAFLNHQMKIYKAEGYFRYELMAINTAFFILKKGVKEFTEKYVNVDEFNFAVRLNIDCKANSFFNLQYPEIVRQYQINKSAMALIIDVIEAIRFIKDANQNFKHWKYIFEKGKQINGRLLLADPKMGNPKKEHISSLFDDYGSAALEQLYQRIVDWDKKVTWL